MTPLKRLLTQQGRKNRWLAQQCAVDEAGLSFIINGKRVPTLLVALKIAKVMGASVEELWGFLLEGDIVE